ncbi:MAG TPA: NUDIX hydrolase [Gemmatimonadaceae bacterium]
MSVLAWGRRVQAIAQTGLAYCREPYDRERYEQLLSLAHEMLARAAGVSPERIAEAFSVEKGYPTPKVDVRAAVFRDGRLLLVREKSTGRWTLPGGWADVGDSASEMAARETREEAGFEVRPVKLLAVFDKARQAHPPSLFYAYKMFFRCEIVGGEARSNHETAGVDFFARDALPPLDTDRTTAGQVDCMFAHFDEPDRPTDFD